MRHHSSVCPSPLQRTHAVRTESDRKLLEKQKEIEEHADIRLKSERDAHAQQLALREEEAVSDPVLSRNSRSPVCFSADNMSCPFPSSWSG